MAFGNAIPQFQPALCPPIDRCFGKKLKIMRFGLQQVLLPPHSLVASNQRLPLALSFHD